MPALRLTSRAQLVACNIAVAVVYAIAVYLSVRFAHTVDQATLVWPASGIALAFCLRGGIGCAPGLFVSAFVISAWRHPVWVAAGIASGVTLGAVAGALLLLRAGFDQRFNRRRDVLTFVGVGVLFTTLLSPTLATAVLGLAGRLHRPTAWEVWREWWLGDAAGVLVVTPALLLLTRARLADALRGRLVEALVLTTALVVTADVVFFDRFEPLARHLPLAFLTFPLLVWVSLRFEAVGAATAVLILAAFAVWGTALGHGPLLGPDVTVRLALFWAYIGAAAGIGLLMTALEAERGTLLRTLSASETRNRDLIEQASDAIYVTDSADRIVDVNQRCIDLVGCTRDELVGRPGSTLVAPDDLARLALTPAMRVPGERAVTEWRIARKDGDIRWVEASSTLLSDGRRQGIVRDITARHEAEAALAASRSRERLLLDQVPAIMWTTDVDGSITSSVGSGLARLGLTSEAIVGHPMVGFADEATGPGATRAAFERALAGEAQALEAWWRGARLQCDVRPLRDNAGQIQGTIGVAIDITEHVELREQVQQAQKMESVGQLAGGIAHDFNNLLQVIQGYTLLARDPGIAADERDDNLSQVLSASERASQLTQQLLTFARRQPIEIVDVDLVDLAGHMLNLIRRLIGEHIEMAVEARVASAFVRCDRAQVEQVLLNLCLNARDAMPRGGRLDVVIDEEPRTEAQGPHVVRLTVRDTGVGMDKETLDRIFEPFFTTKPQGSGTGLGLSVVYGIIRQHDGRIEVDSEPGAGAAFTVSFPAAAVSATPEARDAPSAVTGGSEAVLLAEDEPAVRDLAVRVLEGAGYQVLVAVDGEDAVRVFEHNAAAIELAILDVVMPRCSGLEAYQRISAARPDLPVLFCSGYAGMGNQRDPFPEGLALLTKPYTPDELLRAVREQLARMV
jgi:PAS domain S-box-containing protein